MLNSVLTFRKLNFNRFSYSIRVVLLGHMLERFDVTLFAYVLPLFMSLFFPPSLQNATLLSLAAFSAAYIARPFGAVLFGQWGDRRGRKGVFTNTLLLTVFAAIIMGFLPTYESIGVLAPALMIFCRLLQGLASGAEFIAGSVFVHEHKPKDHPGWLGSLITATGLCGAIFAAGIAFWAASSPDFIWRGAFIMGAGATSLVYWTRLKIQESPIFLNLQKDNKLQSLPIINAIQQYPKQIILGIMLGGCSHMVFYTSTVYFSMVLMKFFSWPASSVALLNLVVLLGWFMLSFAYGGVSSYFSLNTWLRSSLLLVSILVTPLFYCLYYFPSFWTIPFFIFTYLVISAPFVCMLPGYFSLLFPAHLRLSGLGLSIMVGQALFGGSFPLIAVFLVDSTNMPIAPSIFIAFLTMFSSILLYSQKLNQEKMQ